MLHFVFYETRETKQLIFLVTIEKKQYVLGENAYHAKVGEG